MGYERDAKSGRNFALSSPFSVASPSQILPDVSNDYLEEAVKLATRVSVNLEAPTPQSLCQIAPQRIFGIWRSFNGLKVRRKKGLSAPAGVTTQLSGRGKQGDR